MHCVFRLLHKKKKTEDGYSIKDWRSLCPDEIADLPATAILNELTLAQAAALMDFLVRSILMLLSETELSNTGTMLQMKF